MAKASGRSRVTKNSLSEDSSNYKGKIKNVESLVNMDPTMYKETKKAIARFDAVLGVRTKDVKMADLRADVLGIGNEDGVYLQKSVYKGMNAKQHTEMMKKSEEKGWQVKTNKPVQHVITHELGHSLWNDGMTSNKAVNAGVEIRKLREQFNADKSKKGYGKYMNTNTNEFFAEMCTRAVHGTQDKYTAEIKNIIKKYKL